MVEYIDASFLAMTPLFGFVGLAFAIILVVTCLKRKDSKSYEYRRMLTDMFVVGKIKQLAVEEGIDIIAELKEFAKTMKQKKIECETLDTTIETELQEKITKVMEEKDKTSAKK